MLNEFEWIRDLIDFRIRELVGSEEGHTLPPMPSLTKGISPYYDHLIEEEVTIVERIALSLGLVSSSLTQFLDALLVKNTMTERLFTETGALIKQDSKELITTWQTVMFLAYGRVSEMHFSIIHHIKKEHRLYASEVLILPNKQSSNPFLTPIKIRPELVLTWLEPLC